MRQKLSQNPKNQPRPIYTSFLDSSESLLEEPKEIASQVNSATLANPVASKRPFIVFASTVGLALACVFIVNPIFAESSSSETGVNSVAATQTYVAPATAAGTSSDRDGYTTTILPSNTFTSLAGEEVTYIMDPASVVQWPFTEHFPISSDFGPRESVCGAQGCSSSYHEGVDFAAPSETPIQSVADGVVVESVDTPGGLGSYVKIEHMIDGEKVITAYGHMVKGSQAVKKGDTVKRGQVVGLVGNTGTSFGSHLHFGVEVKGELIDGFEWLKLHTEVDN